MLLVFIFPPLIFYFDSSQQLFLLLLGGCPTIGIAIYLITRQLSPRALGLSLNFASIQDILPQTLIIVVGQWFLLAFVPFWLGYPRSLYWKIDYGWYFYITVFQEIVWRGLAFLLLEQIIGDKKQVVIFGSAFLFAFMHIYFQNLLLLLGSFGLGIHWGQNYWKYRNISGTVLSHYLLGLTFIVLNYMGIKENWSLF